MWLLFISAAVLFVGIKEMLTAYRISKLRKKFVDENALSGIFKEPSLTFRFCKRLTDILFALPVCLLVLPVLYLVLGTAIKLTSSGPIIFTQKRIGLLGKTFVCYKFRSMYVGAGNQIATQNDPRITSVGRFIRRTHLDEFPQFFNVLIGDMSLVGPRPFMADVQSKISDYPQAVYRLLNRPGLTGLVQVSSGRASSPEQIVNKDMFYIISQSWFSDLSILLKTLQFKDNSY